MLLLFLRGVGFRMSNKDVITEDLQLLFGDCLERMKEIPDGSVDATYRDWETDRKSTRLNSSHRSLSRMPSSA